MDDMKARAAARKMTPQAYMAWRQALRLDYHHCMRSGKVPVTAIGYGGSLWRILVPDAAP